MHWIAYLVGKRSKSTLTRNRRPRPLLQTEQLENRLVPSAVAHPTYILFKSASGAHPDGGSATATGLTPATIQQAYGVNQVLFGTVNGTGAGQTIAIIDAYNQPDIASDLAKFDQQYGLQAPPSLKVVNENGGTSLPGGDPQHGWGVETSLDVEWAHAIAPGASILLVEANSASDPDLNAAINTARNYANVSVVSMSFSSDETSSDYSGNSLYTTPSGHNGVTFVAATGDNGAYSDTGSGAKMVGYPAASSNVLAVGGTTLSTAGGVYSSESGWGDGTLSYYYGGSGGGISKYEAQPSYQQGVVTQSTTMRTTPDVSFDADPNSGVPVYDSYDDGASTPWVQVGGTSLATPMWAGVIALANQGRVSNGLGTLDGPSQTLPMLYKLPSSDFHDVTTGNNGYAAGPGYDLVTGLGTPIVNLVARDLSGSSTGSNPTPTIGTFTVSPTAVQVGSTVTLTASNVTETGGTISSVTFYRESNGTAGLQIGSDTLVGSGTANGTTWTLSNVSTTGLAAGTYTYYAVANNVSSSAASATLTITNPPTPTIGSFTVSPTSVQVGGTFTLTASNVTETGGTIRSVTFYRESNGTAGLQIGSDTLVGSGTQSGTTWTLSNVSTTGLVAGTYTYYAVATDGNGASSSAASATLAVTNPPGTPTIGTFMVSPTSVPAGSTVTLTASNVAETGGTIGSVTFYRESGATTVLQTSSATLVGTDTQNNGSGVWTLSASTTGLAAGIYTFFAVATDTTGNTSAAASATLTVTAASTVVATTTQITGGPVTYYRNGTATEVLTVTVTPASGSTPPTGTVAIDYDGQVLGSGTLQVVNGVARVSFTITFYTSYFYSYYTFDAVFEGNSSFAASTSNNFTVGIA